MDTNRTSSRAARRQRGFTLVELMVAVALGMLVMIALIAVYLNVSRTNSEMYKTNGLIENGRFAIDVLNEDLSHAGYWGGYIPRWDDFSLRGAASIAEVPDAASLALGPCNAYASWTAAYKSMLIGVPVEVYDGPPTGCDTTTLIKDQKPGTDALVVRHADTCLPGATNCDAFNANRVYFQNTQCAIESTGGAFYDLNQRANLADFPLKKRGCTGAVGATVGTQADVRRFVQNIYYIRTWASTEGDGVPTLVRASFGVASGAPGYEPAQALIEGIEAFRVELGLDRNTRTTVCGIPNVTAYNVALTSGATGNIMDPATCTYNAASASLNTLPRVRGDGVPENWVHCPAAGCTVVALRDVVAAKIYLVARSRDTSPGHTDAKTYTLGSAGAASFPAADQGYKRHLFQTTVRMPNISARRETPP